ncbi:heparan-alpha-glucosaminide N-acetyltransferase-like [Tachypleus tridentatus]|uniref:heparan-alpha-glucosaminide N-acetyltransferase-like n=1 Tax=Tachypleus tridentatus TaxID=6853 RepID=UPI003FD4875C
MIQLVSHLAVATERKNLRKLKDIQRQASAKSHYINYVVCENVREFVLQNKYTLSFFLFCIALVVMIFVNYGGGKYWFFEHIIWNGLYLVDNNLQKIRIPGVLQRFGVSYFVLASVHMLFAKPNDIHQKTKLASVRDILPYWLEWLIMLCILLTHILLTFLLEVPGCPKGYLGPGGIHNGSDYFNCTGRAAGYFDRIILGEAHIYQHPIIKVIYLSELPYDLEGILGFLTSIVLVFLGLQFKSCGQQNDGWIPINKNLWSVSFIFATGAMLLFFLSILYYIIDVKKWWTGAPFFFSGMNSILLYVGHSLTSELFPWTWHAGQTQWDHLAVDLWGTTLWVIISIWLYYKKFFLAV